MAMQICKMQMIALNAFTFFFLSFEFLSDYLKCSLPEKVATCNTLSLVPNVLMSPISGAFRME